MIYRHTQYGTIIIIGVGLFPAAILVHRIISGCIYPPEWIAAVVLLSALFLFASLTVEVNQQRVVCSFGTGLIHKEIPLSDITDARPVVNSWMAGWGIRWMPGRYLMWNVSGLQAVELTLKNGGKFRIGTDEPDALVSAILLNKSAGG